MRRLHDSRGFTLIEMLLVVAVVSILAAVSIPLASSALDKTRCATDAANERAAKGLASTLHFWVRSSILTARMPKAQRPRPSISTTQTAESSSSGQAV